MKYYKQIMVVGLPILLGHLGVIITGFVDAMMVGRYSTDALASASFVNSVFNLMNIVCLGFSYGLTPIVGAYFANGETSKIGAVVKTATLLNVLFGLLCGVVMLVMYVFLDEMGQPEHLLPLMRPYYMVILLSMLPLVIVNALRQFTDGITDTKLGMVIRLGGNVLNVLGNWVLIYGKFGLPEWGLYGAGVSTLVARVLMLVAYVVCLCAMKKYRGYMRGFIDGIVTFGEIRQVTKLSLPIS
ncbi:MAG: polysaccharide biosynthesis C-terminal domain-containing protein, partial [Bacteroidaceae bacterium]|nr:polysaccharide biosynthesis C-terminal domain-containing protein [Bacteroidaceae bacterium]